MGKYKFKSVDDDSIIDIILDPNKMIIKRDKIDDLIIKFDKHWYLDKHETIVTDAICYEKGDVRFEAFFAIDFMISIMSEDELVYIPYNFDNPFSFLYELSQKINIKYEVLDVMYKLHNNIIYNGEGDIDFVLYFRYTKSMESRILRFNESVKDKLSKCVTGNYYKMNHKSSNELFIIELDDIYKHVYEYTDDEYGFFNDCKF